jgi:hypothetical protein
MDLRRFIDNLSLQELGANLQFMLAASAQHQLYSRVDSSLLLHEGELFNTFNGESRRLVLEGTWAVQVAQTARLLLPVQHGTAAVQLLLPSASFISTRFDLRIQGEQLIKSSLSLQLATLLPACEEPLQLALDGKSSRGIALWFPKRTADALFQAFAEQGLQLSLLLPRVLAVSELDSPSALLLDEDDSHLCMVETRHGILENWLSVHKRDLESEAFRQQWLSEVQNLDPAGETRVLDRDYWSSLRTLPRANEAYSFFPQAALQAGKTLLARKQRKAGMLAAAAMVLLLALPFMGNWAQITWLERQVAQYQVLSADARRSQAAVFAMEDEWGAVAEYPQQDIDGMLLVLNQYIDGSLSSINVNKGVVDISGLSPDPTLIIEQLAELEMFYGVGQSRSSSGGNTASRGDRFGIRMNLSAVDFAAYEKRYPAIQQ